MSMIIEGRPDLRGLAVRRAAALWYGLGLARQFALAGFAVSLLGIFTLGHWVSRQIETNVLDNAGTSTAVSLSHFVAPHLQELTQRTTLSPQTIDALDRVIANLTVTPRVEFVKVWLSNGQLVYGTTHSHIGRIFPIDDALKLAWSGAVVTALDPHPGEAGPGDRATYAHMVEVNAPIHEEGTGEVIAVVEFYYASDQIEERLARAKWQSWLFTGLLALVMIGSLFAIVADGSRMIDRDHAALKRRIAELSTLVQQNRALRDRVERGARRAVEDTERLLRETGAELQDGPIRLISLALLRLDGVPFPPQSDAPSVVRRALADAIEAIRNVAPAQFPSDGSGMSLADAIQATIRDHEARTGTRVAWFGTELPAEVPDYARLCLCRFTHEGLADAFRRGGGKGQRVAVRWEGRTIAAEVSDEGGAKSTGGEAPGHRGLRLERLCALIESVGGTMAESRRSDEGTRLVMRLPIDGDARGA